MNKIILIFLFALLLSACKSTDKQDTTTNTTDTMVVKPDTLQQ